MQKGDFIAIQYTQKILFGKPFGMPEINSAMVQINKNLIIDLNIQKMTNIMMKRSWFSQTFLFQIPVTFARISSHFTNKRFHPVLKGIGTFRNRFCSSNRKKYLCCWRWKN